MNNKGTDLTWSAALLFAYGVRQFPHDVAHLITVEICKNIFINIYGNNFVTWIFQLKLDCLKTLLRALLHIQGHIQMLGLEVSKAHLCHVNLKFS